MLSDLAGVRWGSAIAAYQIEGGAAAGGRSPSIWDTFSKTPGNTVRGDTGDVAADVYGDPEPMLDAIAWTGIEVYRLSISWSRLIPTPGGGVNPDGAKYYRRVFEGLRERGVTPVVTLYHWDLPQWLQDRGGWTSLETVDAFVQYVTTAVRLFGDLVTDWVTINEPFCVAFHGHLSALHAPGIRDEAAALRVAMVQLHAHGEAVRAIRAVAPASRVGLAMNLSDLEAGSDSPEDLDALRRADLVENRLFLHTVVRGILPDDAADYFGAEVLAGALDGIDIAGVAEPIDFFGANYYEHNVVRAASPGSDPIVRGVAKLTVPEPRSANGVAVRPDGFTRVLLRVSQLAPELPIWVTENGIGLWDYLGPDRECNDVERVSFLDQYLQAMAEAKRQGARVEAYFHWCFMDTFEWSFGYQLKYGLFYVDFPTSRLIPKASAVHYRALIAELKTQRR